MHHVKHSGYYLFVRVQSVTLVGISNSVCSLFIDCGCQAHRKCGERAPAQCLPAMKHLRRVFGVDLTTLALASRGRRPSLAPSFTSPSLGSSGGGTTQTAQALVDPLVPEVLVRLVAELETRPGALASEGLYRQAGFHEHVDILRTEFDKGERTLHHFLPSS